MRRSTIFNRISVKLGLLFSGVFLPLLLLLGFLLYGVFTNLFVDFVNKDLLIRGSNHAKALEEDDSQKMIEHIISMEKGGTSLILITDKDQRVLGSSVRPDAEMKRVLKSNRKSPSNEIIDSKWRTDKYLIAVSSISNDKGFIYMYYPTAILRETVSVLKILILLASLGTTFLAVGLIGILSRKITQPLLTMKDATNSMAQGKYRQEIPAAGNDELAQLAYSIQQLGERLQHYEDTRNEFLSAVSHELRTPLTYIKGYSDVLSKGIIKDKDEQAEYLAIINRETKRISYLVNDLFEMSKLQVGKFQLNKEIANINQVVEKAVGSLKPSAEKKGIVLNMYLSEGLSEINVDLLRIEQVIYNIVENAIKYTDKGEVDIETRQNNHFIMIIITDTGIGIPDPELLKIWDRFYRIEKSRARKTGGTGLGLYIVKQLIEAHHGEIKVKSSEGQGTAFTIYLPKEGEHE
jgi:two-component system sensor histidine kinase BaeS